MGQVPVPRPALNPEVVEEPEDGPDDFDTPYRPAESIRLPFREADFPIIMRQLLAASPANRKVPIFISTLSPLGALATRLRVKYPYDIMLHAILLQTIIEAPPSTGKRCFAEVVRQIIEPTLEARDKQQRRLEQEYREKKNARAQNEKIGQAPKTTVRCIPPATSKTVIVKRADFYERILGDTLTFWMWAEELAQLGDAGKSGFSNLRTVMRIAYDLGSKFGQDFASDNSYSGTADVCICSMFCATPQDVDEIYTRKEVMGGGTSRVILVTLEDEAGAKVDKRKPLIEQLTTVFTRAQLVALIQQNGLDTEARFFISQWKSNGWIIKLRKNVYQKQV